MLRRVLLTALIAALGGVSSAHADWRTSLKALGKAGRAAGDVVAAGAGNTAKRVDPPSPQYSAGRPVEGSGYRVYRDGSVSPVAPHPSAQFGHAVDQFQTPTGLVSGTRISELQGTSARAGDFRGIEGQSFDEIVSRVPPTWRLGRQNDGTGIHFTDTSGAERLRLHGPNPAGRAGSNSASGWVARVHAPGKYKYYDNAGNVVGKDANSSHISIKGNPNALD